MRKKSMKKKIPKFFNPIFSFYTNIFNLLIHQSPNFLVLGLIFASLKVKKEKVSPSSQH